MPPLLFQDLRCHEDFCTFLPGVDAWLWQADLTWLPGQWCVLCPGNCVVMKVVIGSESLSSELCLMNDLFCGVIAWLICCLPCRKCLKENEETKNQALKNCKKQEEFLAQLGDFLDPEKKNEKASDEDLILKVNAHEKDDKCSSHSDMCCEWNCCDSVWGWQENGTVAQI